MNIFFRITLFSLLIVSCSDSNNPSEDSKFTIYDTIVISYNYQFSGECLDILIENHSMMYKRSTMEDGGLFQSKLSDKNVFGSTEKCAEIFNQLDEIGQKESLPSMDILENYTVKITTIAGADKKEYFYEQIMPTQSVKLITEGIDEIDGEQIQDFPNITNYINRSVMEIEKEE